MPPGASVADALRASVEAGLEHEAANERGLRTTGHRDFLHQTRVAIRRIRCAFSLFRPVLREDRNALDLAHQLRTRALALGPARDVDVLIIRAETLHWPAQDRGALHRQRERAYTEVFAALADPGWSDLLDRIGDWVAAPRTESDLPLGGRPAREVTDAALAKRHRRILRGGPSLATMSDHDLHRVRIEGKKLRYGCEFFTDLYPDGNGDTPLHWSQTLSRLQDALGAANDHAVATRILADAGLDVARLPPPPARTDAITAWQSVAGLSPFWGQPTTLHRASR